MVKEKKEQICINGKHFLSIQTHVRAQIKDIAATNQLESKFC